MRLPDGFAQRVVAPGLVLACRAERMDQALAAGLGKPETWSAAMSPAATGRGLSGRIAIGGLPLHLKQLRRGGLLAKLWRDRFPGDGRIGANLAIAQEALKRGVPTAAPVAGLVRRHALGFCEGWLATEEIAGAQSLYSALAAGTAGEQRVRAALRAARDMHDRGIVHPDLNLGNLLIRGDQPGMEGFVIDLDRAYAVPAPVSLKQRKAALLRLERSYAKWFGSAPSGTGAVAGVWYRLYADGRSDLSPLLAGGGPLDRLRLSFHRLAWKLTGRGRAAHPGGSRTAR